MPAYLERDLSGSAASDGSTTRLIRIGLINNMPDAALEATERQFLTLLNLACGDLSVAVSLYALPGVPRADSGQRHVSRNYCGIGELMDDRLDGLIVTGMEPRAMNLTDEPSWEDLIRVIEWAEHNTSSTVWSCLAAHAAVFHTDGIRRHRLHDKRFGVFEYARASDHVMTSGVPSTICVPHSRWNDIRAVDLTDCGYRLLTCSDDGADAFVKQRKSLFVFFQGHPEYEANSLLLEYRRDVGRYIRRENDTYPSLPRGYLDTDTAEELGALQTRAMSDRREELLREFPTSAAGGERIADTWRSAGVRIYRNWLACLCSAKERQIRERPRRQYSTNRRERAIAVSLLEAEMQQPSKS